jgi:hypothetical protein
MIEPLVHLAYAPRGPGLLYALLWFAEGPHVYGWFIGERDGEYLASYFMLQDHYTTRTTQVYRSAEDDVHGPWLECRGGRDVPLTQSPVSEALRHELARLQDAFIRQWLFFRDDPQAQDQARELNARELAVRHVNIHPSRLGKLHTAAAVWRYDEPGADLNVPATLATRWPLEHRTTE